MKSLIDEIAKLKASYDTKIANCDKLIETQRRVLSKYRRQALDEAAIKDQAAIMKERAISQAQRQAYVQAKYDIDSLLDHL